MKYDLYFTNYVVSNNLVSNIFESDSLKSICSSIVNMTTRFINVWNNDFMF